MAPRKANGTEKAKNGNGANLGFEAKLFLAADKLRKNLEPSDYKHVVLGLIFLRHISQAFEAKHAQLLAEDPASAEDQDEYLAENIFWVPKEARWSHLQANAKLPTIGKLIDEAMAAIEAANPTLKGVLPKDYNRPALDKIMLGELIDLLSGDCRCIRKPDRPATCWVAFMSISSAGLPGRKASAAESSTRRAPWCGCWWKCWSPFPTPPKGIEGPRLRPLLRFRRHVRSGRTLSAGSRRPHRRPRHLRAGKQLHDLASCAR